MADVSTRLRKAAGTAGSTPASTPAPAPRAAARTHPGRVRLNNEDVPVVDAARGVFGVIDGIGGHAGGEVAAAMAKDVILQRLSRPLGTPAERVREAIAIANNTIFRWATDRPELAGMACVVTLALIADGRLTIGHVGDTRLYKLRGTDILGGHSGTQPAQTTQPAQSAQSGQPVGLGIRKLTRDHSPVGEREDAGDLSEADAMRHPHRNEVFRDVGTVFRDKDEDEFVDIIEEPLETDAAILLCSDGLSDMLPSASIAHIVCQHAGDPEEVVEALVDAANDAGGKDNITVVYVEMPRFAEAAARGIDQRSTPTEPPPPRGINYPPEPYQQDPYPPDARTSRNSALRAAAEQPATDALPGAAARLGTGALTSSRSVGLGSPAAPLGAPDRTTPAERSESSNRGRWIGRAARAVISSRATWFTIGALGGVFGAIALTAWIANHQGRNAQTLIVAPTGVSPYSTIAAALSAARPGDTVRVEPGIYREHVELGDGIDLVARVPGTATIIAPANDGTPLAALSITGSLNVRVAGIRIESESETPIDTAVYVAAPAATLELIEINGNVRRAFAISAASSITVRGSRISVTDSLLAVPEDGRATLVDSILTRIPRSGADAAAGSATGSRGTTGASPSTASGGQSGSQLGAAGPATSAERATPVRNAVADYALSMTPTAHIVLRGNVFAGFGTRIVDGVAQAQRAELLSGNIVVPSEEHVGAAQTAPPAGSTTTGRTNPAPASAPSRAPATPAATPGSRRRGRASHQASESGR